MDCRLDPCRFTKQNACINMALAKIRSHTGTRLNNKLLLECLSL